jgi:hypothetical protein
MLISSAKYPAQNTGAYNMLKSRSATSGLAAPGQAQGDAPAQIGSANRVGTYIAGETWDEHVNYCRVHQFTKGQFAVCSSTFDNQNQMSNRLRIAPFTVNQSTGAMVWGTPGNAFENTGGYVHSTQSFGFHGNLGISWGNSAWGSNTTAYNGGTGFRVENNTIYAGFNSGNTNYASENTSNGMLALYEYNGNTYFNIPNGAYTSLGGMNSSAGIIDWPSASESTTSGTSYIWRCVGKTLGEGKAGMRSDNNGVAAMNNTGGNGSVGSTISPTGSGTRNGIGFELENGKEIYFSSNGSFVRSGNQAYVASVSRAVGSGHDVLAGATDLGIIGVTYENMSYYTGGTPAKEADTFYMIGASTASSCTYLKFKIVNTSNNDFTLELLGSVDLDDYTIGNDMIRYDGLVDVTGNNDDFLVMSARSQGFSPSVTLVTVNPLKDR